MQSKTYKGADFHDRYEFRTISLQRSSVLAVVTHYWALHPPHYCDKHPVLTNFSHDTPIFRYRLVLYSSNNPITVTPGAA